MNHMDLISALFQGGAGFMIMLNIIKIHKDKFVRGVSIYCQGFMVAWGIFAPIYFISLNQILSTISAIFILMMNTIWFIQILYYTRKEGTNL